jgi:hypothetical protein
MILALRFLCYLLFKKSRTHITLRVRLDVGAAKRGGTESDFNRGVFALRHLHVDLLRLRLGQLRDCHVEHPVH